MDSSEFRIFFIENFFVRRLTSQSFAANVDNSDFRAKNVLLTQSLEYPIKPDEVFQCTKFSLFKV